MRIDFAGPIDRKQWLSRMGVKGDGDAGLLRRMDLCEKRLLSAAASQGVYRVVKPEALELKGQAIRKHLAGCTEAVLLGVTLGAGVDHLIRGSQIRDMAEAFILDCGASVLAEQVGDLFEERIRRENSMHFTGRYSPGYGDYPLECQDELIRLLDGARKIGLNVSRSHLLIPRKSITAVMGGADHPVSGYLATCGECTLRDTCVLRKEGRNCAGF